MTLTIFERVEVKRGTVLRDLEIERLELRYCSGPISFAADDLRPRLENVTIKRLRVRRSHLSYGVLRNVVIDGMDIDVASSFLNANEYYGVTFKGRIKQGVIFTASPINESIAASYEQAIARAECQPDWGIDISEMQGRVSVRGYSADGFTINPHHQCIVRNNPASLSGWEKLDLTPTLFAETLKRLVANGWKDTILAADGNAKNYDEQLAVVHLLREKGIAE